ncbi:MAG TPA: N-acetyltransferase [Gammaproteobacteria bacterium]|nr:N-acetyltransferase [Gammaproteobacteria bacterium]
MPEQSRFHIAPVENDQQLETFIRLPWSIYRDDPAWVPPLIFERKEHLSKKNPFFEHARWQAWLAMEGERPVGRISAQIDRLYLERYDDKCGYFGMLEAIDDPAVFSLLLETAEQWLRDEGMEIVRGPFNLSINDECGLLVEGYETPPSLMMGHARPYYAPRIEEQSYTLAKQLLAYHIAPNFEPPEIMQKLVRKASRSATVRPLRRKQIDEELEIMRDIFNDAWSNNWGFVPFTRAEFKEIGRNLLMLVNDDFVQIAEIDGEPVAMIVALPNVNEAIKDLDGKLFPTGLLKLLWRLKVKYPRSGRIPLMGVRKRYHHTPLGPGLAYLVISAVHDAVKKRGIEEMEMSWILENNAGMRNIIETTGGVIYKRYNIYQKAL